MLSPAHVARALEAKSQAFVHYQQRHREDRLAYERALAWLCTQEGAAILAALGEMPRPGALPTTERHAGESVVLPFAPQWANHAEARAWAMQVLRGVTTLAVDGSQIPPSRDFSIPVGAVQVAWFENAHSVEGRYVKDLVFEVLTPEELAPEEDDAGAYPDVMVNVRRFVLECEMLAQRMERLAGQTPAPVCFLDGSLVISFAAQMRPALRNRHIEAIARLLDASQRTRVPLVGYVDNSDAKDLVHLLRALRPELAPTPISDGALLRTGMSWGERSEAWRCARDDRLFEGTGALPSYYDRVHFLYLKTTAEHPPVRLDLPAWLLEAGELERVVDVVRAECIVGTGYPYAVETADALAVISLADRERFYRTFQDYLTHLGLDLRYARKALSKRGRR